MTLCEKKQTSVHLRSDSRYTPQRSEPQVEVPHFAPFRYVTPKNQYVFFVRLAGEVVVAWIKHSSVSLAGSAVQRDRGAAEPRAPVGAGRGDREGAGVGVRGGGARLRAAGGAARAAGAAVLAHAAHAALAPRLLPRALPRQGLPGPPKDPPRECRSARFLSPRSLNIFK